MGAVRAVPKFEDKRQRLLFQDGDHRNMALIEDGSDGVEEIGYILLKAPDLVEHQAVGRNLEGLPQADGTQLAEGLFDADASDRASGSQKWAHR